MGKRTGTKADGPRIGLEQPSSYPEPGEDPPTSRLRPVVRIARRTRPKTWRTPPRFMMNPLDRVAGILIRNRGGVRQVFGLVLERFRP